MRPVAPVRCPHCRQRLTSKNFNPKSSDWYRWCKRCRCVVTYVYADDEWARGARIGSNDRRLALVRSVARG